MQDRTKTLFFALAIAVLLNMLFVLQSGGGKEVRALRNEIVAHVTLSFQQTIGDKPWFTEVAAVYEGIEELFVTSADILAALLEPTAAEDDLILVASRTYDLFVKTMNVATTEEQPRILGANFMADEPIYNILPPFHAESYQPAKLTDQELSNLAVDLLFKAVISEPITKVAGVGIDKSPDNPWVTIGNCLSVYNGESSRYLWSCVAD